MKKTKMPARKELRVVFDEGSVLDQQVERLVTHFGIDRPAVLKMAIKKLDDIIADNITETFHETH